MATTIRLYPAGEAALGRRAQLDNVSKSVAIFRVIVEEDPRCTSALTFDAVIAEESLFFSELLDRLKCT